MNKKHFLAAMYLRLSRDDSDVGDVTDKDGRLKSESNSIGNQRELIRAFIHEQQDIELYDIYVDDGFSGSNFDRPEFKRMISDIEAGKVNCVIVKDLSRFGRDYIESGRYIQKIFPALSVRFIALTDHYDSFHADAGEKIFNWKMEGVAVSAIADKLNELGILSPKEYKKSTGENYRGGFSGAVKSMWSSATVKRILTNEMYLGHMVQGKTKKINYKLKKSVEKPEKDWVKVENTHEPIISEDVFLVVQNLLKVDGRVSPVSEKNSFFTGILFCGDCGEQMIRRVNRYKNTQRVYYICSTKNRGEGCTRHSIPEDALKQLVLEMVTKFANCFLQEKQMFEKALDMETNFESIVYYDTEIARLKKEQDKYYSLCSGLYEDLKEGIITKSEFERLHSEFKRKAGEFEEAQKKQELMIKELFKNGVISAARLKTMQDCSELREIDRYTLCSMVKKISVYENHRIEIEFYYTDQYRIMREVNKRIKDEQKKNCVAERSA